MEISFDVLVVTFNSKKYIERCLQSLFNQNFKNFKVYVWDNNSQDKTLDVLEKFSESIYFIKRNGENIGFSRAINNLIEISNGTHIIFLNPDVILPEDFLYKTSTIIKKVPGTIIPVPKLMRYDEKFNFTNLIDSAGIYWTPFQRHLDRGSARQDNSEYKKEIFVGGVSGALSIWDRKVLNDLAITIDGRKEYLDEDFFVYREDADISIRGLIYGYRFKFFPDLVAYHKRQVIPQSRKKVPGTINYHSFKNRFLLRVKNIPFIVYFIFFIPFSIRDIAACLYCMFFERKSLNAIPFLYKNFGKFLYKRKQVLSKRKIGIFNVCKFFLGIYNN